MVSSTKAGSGGGPTLAARAQLSLQRLLSRNALIVAAALAASVVLAWAWLAGEASGGVQHHGMGAMQVEPWSGGYLLPAFTMWSLMMVAMMLPSAAPMILLHARIQRADSARGRLLHSLLFTTMYLLVWFAFSAVAALAQAALIDAGALSAASLALGDRELTAALLAGAALYQLSPVKAACLHQCQAPLMFVMRYWRPGAAGAVRLGLAHGVYCLGCCWPLMLLLFAGGVMNLAWVAALALVVLAEKVAPPRWHLSRIIAGALGLGALLVLLGR